MDLISNKGYVVIKINLKFISVILRKVVYEWLDVIKLGIIIFRR